MEFHVGGCDASLPVSGTKRTGLFGLAIVSAVLTWACGSTAPQAGNANNGGGAGSVSNSGGATTTGGTTSGAAEPDATGYAVVGFELYPPLLQRALAVDCQPGTGASGECVSDDDCGEGKACVCGGLPGFDTVNRCLPAECRISADCPNTPCLLSLGGTVDGCCTFGNAGLFCGRGASTCVDGEDCPGNGQACIYRASNDRFECQLLTCKCGG